MLVISGGLISALGAIRDPERQTVHDIVTGTLISRKGRPGARRPQAGKERRPSRAATRWCAISSATSSSRAWWSKVSRTAHASWRSSRCLTASRQRVRSSSCGRASSCRRASSSACPGQAAPHALHGHAGSRWRGPLDAHTGRRSIASHQEVRILGGQSGSELGTKGTAAQPRSTPRRRPRGRSAASHSPQGVKRAASGLREVGSTGRGRRSMSPQTRRPADASHHRP